SASRARKARGRSAGRGGRGDSTRSAAAGSRRTPGRASSQAKQASAWDASAAGIPWLRHPAPCGTMRAVSSSRLHRGIPSVERLRRAPAAVALQARWKRDRVVEALRQVLREVRRELDAGGALPPAEALLHRAGARLDATATPRLQRVVNATGVVLHTNLG